VPAGLGRERLAAFGRAFPDGLAMSFPKRGRALARDFKWTGNPHYGFVHRGAPDRQALRERAERASALLGWPAPYAGAAPWARPTDRPAAAPISPGTAADGAVEPSPLIGLPRP
jgi:hypothetical protein